MSIYVHLDVEEIVAETDKALLLRIDGEEKWVPLSIARGGWSGNEDGYEPIFTNCNVCGITLRTEDEDRMGMCERCAGE